MAAAIPTTFQIGAKITPQAAAANYTSGASGKGTKWATNYLQSKVNPFQAAAAAANTWLTNINQAGTTAFVQGLNAVNQAQVAKLVSTQGPTLYSQGIVNKGSPNYATAATGLIPAIQAAAAALPPRGTAAQNDARMTQMVASLRAMKGQYKARS
jgi:hypothetical protein